MPHIAADRVKETTTTTGTGALALAGAAAGFRAFSAVCAVGDTCFYAIVGSSEWEVGLGTYSAADTLTRTTVLASSNAGAAVNLSAGSKEVFLTTPAAASGWGVTTASPSAKQNDYSPAGLALAGRLRLTPTASIGITGLATGMEGRRLTIENASDFLVWLEHQSTASAAANRLVLPRGFPAFLLPGDVLTLLYDGIGQRWRVAEWPNQGPAMGLTEFSDFNGGTTGPFANTVSGTGAGIASSTYLVNTTERPSGAMQGTTGTTATGRATVGAAGTDAIIPTLGAVLSVARLAAQAANSGTETWQLISGFADSAGGTFTDGVAWNLRWNGSAAEWSQDRLSNGTATRSATGSPTPDTNYLWLVVFVNADWTRADFLFSTDSQSFTMADSPTTGLPGSGRPTAWVGASIIKSVGTTARLFALDLAGLRVDSVRG